MNVAETMKQELEQLKSQANSLLAENKIEEAEAKTVEIKVLKAQIEIQEKLDEANSQLAEVTNKLTTKEEELVNLQTELDTVKNEKQEVIDKYNESTGVIADLNSKVTKMQPIVDKYYEDEKTNKINDAISNYKAKFEKIDASEVFETEDIQNLVKETVSEDKEVSNKAKYALSDKLFELLDKQNITGIDVKDIQEPTKPVKDLNPEHDEFEATYGFKKQ